MATLEGSSASAVPACEPEALHLAWTDFQRRQVSMAGEAGFECVFMPLGASSAATKAVAYGKLSLRTIELLRHRRPKAVWVQLPQVPLLWAVLCYRRLFAQRMHIIADCHNAMFRKPWARFPFGMSLLDSCDCVLVHNDSVRDQALALGVPASKLLVLEDVPPDIEQDLPQTGAPAFMAGRPRPWVLLPGSFAADEPVGELFAAARMQPEATYVITGRTSNAARNGHDLSRLPANVVLPGFLPREQFEHLLRHADVVLGLTRVEGIQLSACSEALGYGKPLVISNTRLLVELFGAASEIVDSGDPASIAEGVRRVANDAASYRAAARRLARQRRAIWRDRQLSKLRAFLDMRSAAPAGKSVGGRNRAQSEA